MDALIASQHVLFGRMSRTGDNLKKMGKDNITEGLLRTTLANLDARWQQFEAQDASILAIATEEDKKGEYFTLDVFSLGEAAFCVQKGQLLEALKGVATTSTSSAPRARSSLPRIELPTFSGSYLEWTRFRDLFTALIIDDASWSDAERFHYLSASLTGEAAQLIRRIPLASENFDRVWELLENRYDNHRLLVDAQFDLLYTTRACHAHNSGELKRILDTTSNVAAVLNSLDVPVDDKSHWMVQHIVRRLDEQTLKEWEASLGSSTDPPTYSELIEFLEKTIRTLEAFETRHGQRQVTSRPPARKVKAAHVATESSTKKRCRLCEGAHLLCFCEAYRSRTPQERLHFVTSRHLCHNCLSQHDASACTSTRTCQRCSQKHHTSLHDALVKVSSPPLAAALHISSGSTKVEAPVSVLLATALVAVTSAGRTITTRALIDPCSEVSLVSESVVQHLRLPRTSCTQVIVGAGAKETATARGKVRMTIAAVHHTQRSCPVEALILPRLTSYRPRCRQFPPSWPHITGLTLADPSFNSSTPIELLLGADVYPQIILEGLQRGGHVGPVAQETIFGWILSGPTTNTGHDSSTVSSHSCTTEDLSALVRRFWEQEEVTSPEPQRTAEETACEQLFRTTHSRDVNGRYQVRLCFKGPVPDLGETHCIARRILLSNERRFRDNSTLRTSYTSFMTEYRNLGHMLPVQDEDCSPRRPHFYLPHHGVLKSPGASAKLRVVFNGSRPSTTGTSLNDHLSAGPKLQRDLMDILLRWRRHKVAFIADIEKMYRQIRVHPADWDFQRILWRDSPDKKIDVFRLTTVTYGLTCAPYLALRTLLQLADDEETVFPRGAEVLRSSTYVDDILSGADTIEEAVQTQEELRGICRAGGFTLKKWSANHSDLLSGLPLDFLADPSTSIPWYPESGCSALGLMWHPATDCLSFSTHIMLDPSATPLTKRRVLSQIAKLFDPLGWLSPFVIRGKIFLQDLWRMQLGWDDLLPSTTAAMWTELLQEMPTLSAIRIPRWLGVDNISSARQVHIFVDASEKAFAAVAYLRVEGPSGKVTVNLLASKTKAAPLKTVSLPRLELCAATLGARLLVRLRRELHVEINAVHLWSDSTVALAWLRGEPSRWHTFVANRVAEVQTTVPDVRLHHVGTKDNPADCASRGIPAHQLIDHPLWWHGPGWLTDPPAVWDVAPESCTTTEEEKAPPSCIHCSIPEDPELLLRFSTLNRLVRVSAWCLRWKRRSQGSPPTPHVHLQPEELQRAEECWIRLVQHIYYAADIATIERQAPLPRSSRLAPMSPFLDDRSILRVGGRIRNSLLSYDDRHPIILPAGCHLTRLLVDQAHLRTLHGGVQLTLASLRHRYWVPQGRRLVKGCISQCLRCIRWRAAPVTQVMGDLPPHRVTPSRPFQHSGLDYAGPFRLKIASGRGFKATKGYVAIFVCFSTRAVHIEAVTDYSTPAFLAAFRRFTGRRGLCTTITSDCGTNFVGADRELRRMFAASSPEAAAISLHLAKDRVTWKFIPPGAPHFGGLWEAAVRSVKHHLRRVIGDDPLTYEELSTLLCQVEACLNSRPLQAITDDPQDLSPLTPGHFLIGGPLTAVPEPTLLDTSSTRLNRWQMVQQRLEHFWGRWSDEYLHQLQAKGKWATPQPSLRIGDLVLIRSELTPPSKWPLGRIIEVHPGADDRVRVVTVRTATSNVKRPVTKIIYLDRASAS